MDLALNNLQKLICHKTQTTNPSINLFCTGIAIKRERKENKEVLLVFILFRETFC